MNIFKYLFTGILLLFISHLSFAQIKGRVITTNGQPIQSTTVSIQNTYTATSTNANGAFDLKIEKQDSCVLIFQNLGFQTKKVIWRKQANEPLLLVTLDKKEVEIEEVVIKSDHNPADRIIKNAIAHRKTNGKVLDKYEADFYSKGAMLLDKLPTKILGRKIDTAEVKKETAGSNVLYLSETISKIKVEKPNKMHEQIIASKISGDNKGMSFNRAEGTDFELYSNYIIFNNNNIISPIADQAFSYYTYQLVNSFEEENQTIYKIKVLPKRKTEPVVDGFIYIVDDTWQIYGADVHTLGSRINIPIIDTMVIKQQYTYNPKDKHWVKQLQVLDFKAGILGIRFGGNFTQTFSNYNFNPSFDKKTFTRVTTEIDKDANKKTDDFWNAQRQVALTTNEIKDYTIKDSIAVIRNSPAYIDSVDRAHSKFKITSILTSYHYQNTPHKLYVDYKSPLSISNISFNTVQGWNIKAGLQARLGTFDDGQLTRASLLFNYGFADNKLYTTGRISHRFNKTNYAQLTLSGGNKIQQFNPDEPISPFINMISSLFFKDNYMKVYGSQFAAAHYSQYVHPNLKINASLNYQHRSNLYNNTSYSFVGKEREYTSNNPLDPSTPGSDAFVNHDILKGTVELALFFKTKIEKLPNEVVYIHDERYPAITFGYTNALYSDINSYKYQEFRTSIKQDINFGNKGTFGYNANVGTFLNGKEMAFVDYKHFNGNQTHVSTTNRYLNSYLLLPYYTFSTNKSYVELHSEYNFKGYLLNKTPVISALKWHTNVGYHLLSTDKRKPYHEITAGFGNIGWGKYRFLRVDYVRTKYGPINSNGIVVGLSLLNMFQ